MHHYDAWGWYTAAELPGRATDAAPPTTSETTTPGQPRANWQGHEWAVWPYVAPPAEVPLAAPVPDAITRAQGKAALIHADLMPAVQQFIASIADPKDRALAEVTMNDADTWRRDNAFLNAAGGALGLTSAQIDDLFRQAATIEL